MSAGANAKLAIAIAVNLLKYFIILLAVVFFIGPILWMLFASFKINIDIVNVNLLTTPTFEHYQKIFSSNDLLKYLIKVKYVSKTCK